MGGVPALIMAAAAGIGFGWTPDGSGGVEYVIQIPPDQVDQVRDAGEISSAIPPEVRGSVSRIVVRITDEPPAQITPRTLAQKVTTASGQQWGTAGREADASAAEDRRVAVPIPSLDSSETARPIQFREAAAGIAALPPQSARKPDPQDGTGLRFPSLGQSVQDAAARAEQSMESYAERAEREISGATNQLRKDAGRAINTFADRLQNAPSASQGDSTPMALPGFTGGAAEDPGSIRSSIGVTTSAGAAAQRGAQSPALPPNDGASSGSQRSYANDRTAAPVGSRSGGPSTDPMPGNQTPGLTRDPRGWRSSGVPLTNRETPGNETPGTQRNGNSAFPPGASTRLDDEPMANQGNQPNYPQSFPQRSVGTGAMPPTANRGSAGDSAEFYARQQEIYGQPARGYQPAAGYEPRQPSQPPGVVAGSGNSERSDAADGYRRHGGLGPHFGRTPIDPAIAAQRDQAEQRSRQQAAWADDRRLDRPPTGDRIPYGDAEPLRSSGGDRSYTSVARRSEAGGGEGPAEQGADESSRARPASAPSDGVRSNSRLPDSGVAAENPISPSNVRVADGMEHHQADSRGRPPGVAAQPLFNGLLLFSFVANIYLAFWLKNMRHQFREMVASKRSAKSPSPVG